MKKKNLFSAVMLSVILLSSCGGDRDSSSEKSSMLPSDETSLSTSDKPSLSDELKSFQGVTFTNQTITYDGTSHSLEVEGAPSDALITYENAGPHIDVGVYQISALITKVGYAELALNATLTITKAPAALTGVEFKNDRYEFDGTEKALVITGFLPAGYEVTYSSIQTPNNNNKAIAVGTYEITATITHKNYEDLTLSATLTIYSNEKQRYLTSFDEKIYFQNSLDKDRLYVYDEKAPDEKVVKVNNSTPKYFVPEGNRLYFVSDSLFSDAISYLEKDSDNLETFLTTNAMYLVSDGVYKYYAKNGLTSDKSGIFRAKESTVDGVKSVSEEQLYTGKAHYLQVDHNYIYFADGNNGNKLVRINKTILNQRSATIMLDEKINNLVISGNTLYFTVNKLLGNYIAKMDVSSSKVVKLTSDAGEYLTIVEDDLYYVNVDLTKSFLSGNGIYKVSTLTVTDHNLPGTLVISNKNDSEQLSSLAYLAGNLYFYRTDNKKLYRYNLLANSLSDLLAEFIPPVDTSHINTKGAVVTYKNQIFYQNAYDNGVMYVYNTLTNTNDRVTSTEADNYYLYENYLYYRTTTYLFNKDLYRLDLLNGGDPLHISKNDCSDLTFLNGKIYYNNRSGTNSLNRMNLDGSDDEVVLKVNAENLLAHNNRLYYITSNYINYYDLTTQKQTKLNDFRSTFFVIYNNNIYFRRLYGVLGSKALAKGDLDGKGFSDLVSSKTDPINFTIVNDVVYYTNEVTLSVSGIFKYDLTSGGNEGELLTKDNYGQNLLFLNNKLYFISYGVENVNADNHFYEFDLLTKSLSIVDNR